MAKRKAQKRELINTGKDKRFLRRDKGGQFSESDDAGKSLSQDRRRKAKKTVKAGHGDKADREAQVVTKRSADPFPKRIPLKLARRHRAA